MTQDNTLSGIRKFDTGATRTAEDGKLDYEGFLSPLVLQRFAEYMHENRIMPDGSMRASDNWQLGIPTTSYMKSMWRHFMDVWRLHRQWVSDDARDTDDSRIQNAIIDAAMERALCALAFNVMGYLHEILLRRHPQYPRPRLDRDSVTL